MAKYTTEIRSICEHYAGLTESTGFEDVDEIIEKARNKIFQNYPIFNENHRAELEHKILKHYYMREIGFETVGLFKLFLNERMAEIMPYYNKLYESETFEFDPFKNVDVWNTHEQFAEAGGSDMSTLGGEDVSRAGGTDVNTLGGEDVSTLGGEDVNRAGGSDTTTAESERNLSNDTDFTENVRPLGAEKTTQSETGRVTTTETPTGTETQIQKTHLNHSDVVEDKFSNTPQNGVSGVDAENYLTEYRKTTTTPTYPSASSNDTVETDRSFTNRSTTNVTQYGDSNEAKKTTTLLEYQEGRRTDTNSQTENEQVETNESETTTAYGKTDTTEYGRTDTTTYGRTDTTDYGRTDTTEYGRTDTTQYGRTDSMNSSDHRTGKEGNETYQEMLQKYRDVILNIDMLIIKNLADLFLNLW